MLQLSPPYTDVVRKIVDNFGITQPYELDLHIHVHRCPLACCSIKFVQK